MAEIAFIVFDLFLLTVAGITAIAVIQVRSLFGAVILAGIYSLIMAMIWQTMDAVDVSFTEAAVGAGISTILLLGALVFTGREEKAGCQRIHWGALALVTATGAALVYGTFDMPRFGDPHAPIHTHRVPAIISQRVGKTHPLPGEQPAWVGEYRAADHGIPPGIQPLGSHHWEADRRSDGDHHVYDGLAPDHAAGHDHTDEDPAHAEVHQGDAHAAHDGHHAHPTDDWHGHVPNIVTSLLAGYRSFDTMFETAVIFTAGMSLVLLLRRRRAVSADRKHEAEGEA